MIEIPIEELDVIFISYDEPMKELHWAQLLAQNPFAKRVDGVTGFDAAHKQAASISDTDRFITVDGDTVVDDGFFDKTLKFEPEYASHIFSWASTNSVNGLVYGNGSLKCWVRDHVFRMNTHENALNEPNKIEFCWGLPYLSMRDSYSTTYPASTPYHAFRAGFREGVKMSLDQGKRVKPKGMFDKLWPGNVQKLFGWASLGWDQPNGLWCIYGARMGVLMTCDPNWDISHVSDYSWFDMYWEEVMDEHHELVRRGKCLSPEPNPAPQTCNKTGFTWDEPALVHQCHELGNQIYTLTDTMIPLFQPRDSVFVKNWTKHQEVPTPKVIV